MAFDINLQFTNYGMSPANVELCDLPDLSKGIKFLASDYFIVQPCNGEQKSKNEYEVATRSYVEVFNQTYFEYFNGYPVGTSIETNFTYNIGEVGSILRYCYSGFLTIRFHDGIVGLYRVVDQSIEKIGREAPCLLVQNSVYKIRIEDMHNRINVYLDDIHLTSFVIEEDEVIEQGLFGVFASADNICNNYNIISTRPDGWLSHGNTTVFGYEQSPSNISSLVVSAIANNSDELSYAYQQIVTTPSSGYSLYLKAGGKSSVKIVDGNPGKVTVINLIDSSVICTQLIDYSEVYNTQSYKLSFTVPANCSTIEVRVTPGTLSTIGVDFLQINKGDQAPFVETSDEIVITRKSVANLPITIAKMNGLNISMVVKPYSNSSDAKNVLVSFPSIDGTKHWILYYDNSDFLCIDYKSGATTNTFVTPSTIRVGEDNNLSLMFLDNAIKLISDTFAPVILEAEVDSDPITFDIISTKVYFPDYTFNKIYLGYSPVSGYARANSSFDYISGSENGITKFMYSFNGSVQESQGSISSTLIGKPTQYSPISVQYDDGTPLSRISSFDEEGNYTSKQIEYVIYSGRKKVIVSCSDIDYKYEPPIMCYTENEGRKNAMTYYFDCNKVDGNNIYMKMDNEQSSRLIGKTFKVIYCTNNSYSIKYNTDNTFKVVMHSGKGEPINVSYDHASIDKSLVKSAIMNPFYNPNQSGFLYLTDVIEPTAYLDITVTPNYLDAKKQEYSLIMIDAYDERGNIVSNSDISIKGKSEIGATITLLSTGKDINDAVTLAKVDMKFFAGRYVYKYTTNKDYGSSNGYILKDTLTITESVSKIIESTSIYIYV